MNTLILTLNRLIETCNDGVKGYQTAARAVDNPNYAKLFNSFANQRATFADALQTVVRHYGSRPEDGETPLLAVLHRAWMHLRALLNRSDAPYAMLSECVRGENIAVANYQTALKEDLPQNVRELIELQYVKVTSVHNRVRVLRDLVAKDTRGSSPSVHQSAT